MDKEEVEMQARIRLMKLELKSNLRRASAIKLHSSLSKGFS
jgi:hypothetical protein